MESFLALLNELDRIDRRERTGQLRLIVEIARGLARSGKTDLACRNLRRDLLKLRRELHDLEVPLGEEIHRQLQRITAELESTRDSLQSDGKDSAAEASRSPESRVFWRRVAAKLIDLVAAGLAVVAVWFSTRSLLAGLTVGWGWFAFSDASRSLGKWCLGLDVVVGPGGRPCGLLRSALRNLPIILLELPERLHRAVLEMNQETFRAAHPELWFTLIGAKYVGYLVLLFWLAARGRSLGDLLAGTRVRRRPKGFMVTRGAAAWLGVAAPIGAGLLVLGLEWGFRLRPPLSEESPAERRGAITAAFGSEAVEVEGPRVEAVKDMFRRLQEDCVGGDPARILARVDLDMLTALLRRRGHLPIHVGAGSLKAPMTAAVAQGMFVNVGWKSYDVRSVRFLDGDQEAIAYVRHVDDEGTVSRVAWWITARNETWRVYDYEVLDLNMRLSVLLGGAFALKRSDLPIKRSALAAVQTLYRAMLEMSAGKLEAARALVDLNDAELPSELRALRAILLASYHLDSAEDDKALSELDRALSLRGDMPVARALRAAVLLALDRPQEALEDARKYSELLGSDADNCVVTSEALLKLGRRAEAQSQALLALKEDPQSRDAVLALGRALPDDHKAELKPPFLALVDLPAAFEQIADALLVDKDLPALRALIDAFRSSHPEHELVVRFEKAIAELEAEGR